MSQVVDNKVFKNCDRTRILATDDEAPVRNLYKMILGYGLPTATVDLACNGLEAVKSFQAAHPALVLMDLRMPEMDGLQAATAILDFCRDNKWQTPAIVFCTGFSQPEALSAIIGNGELHCCLHKPVSSDQIITTVKTQLAKV